MKLVNLSYNMNSSLSRIVSPCHVEFRNSASVYTSKDAKTSPEMEQLDP